VREGSEICEEDRLFWKRREIKEKIRECVKRTGSSVKNPISTGRKRGKGRQGEDGRCPLKKKKKLSAKKGRPRRTPFTHP